MSEPNDKVVQSIESKGQESGISKSPEANQARNADANTMKQIADTNPQAIKGTPTAVFAMRDGDSLEQARVRAMQGKQSTMGVVDEEKGIIHTAIGMIPVIKDNCPYDLAKELDKIVAKSEKELVEKVKHAETIFADLHAANLQAKVLAEVPQPKFPPDTRGAEAHKAVDKPLSTADFEKQRTRFWNENGVEISVKDGKYEYRLRGHEETLCTSDRSPEGIEKAHKQIEALRQAKVAELGKTYGARFTQNGETAGKQSEYDPKTKQWVEGKEDVHCRAPKLYELYGIEAALKVSQPSAHGIKFFLMTNQLYKNLTEMADYHPVPPNCSDKTVKQGAPAVFLNGSTTLEYPPTEAVAKNWKSGYDWSGTSLENSITHELVHHSEATMGWDKAIAKSAKTYGMKEAEAMGWVPPASPTRDTNSWYLEDKNGNYWKHEHVAGKEWVRMKTNGQPLDKNGQPCKYENVDRVTNDQMIEMAKVRPATSYNDTPKEMYAEAMTKFRDGHRADLWKVNPDMYKVMKSADQEEINRAHPPDKKGVPTYIRAADGRIVPNTPEAQAEIQNLEK